MPPINIPKPILRDVPEEMVQSAYDPEAYYPEAADALKRISAMEGTAMKEFNTNIPKIRAQNEAAMAKWRDQMARAEFARQNYNQSLPRGKKSGLLPVLGGIVGATIGTPLGVPHIGAAIGTGSGNLLRK